MQCQYLLQCQYRVVDNNFNLVINLSAIIFLDTRCVVP